MPISVQCPRCLKQISAPESRAGTDGKCPSCGTRVSIPAAFDVPPPFQPAEPERACPFCSETIKASAIKCKHCGEFLNGSNRHPVYAPPVSRYHNEQQPSPGVAAVLSLVIPGAGQMYRGDIGVGFLWLICVFIGYVIFIIPGLVLHIICVVMAAKGASDNQAVFDSRRRRNF